MRTVLMAILVTTLALAGCLNDDGTDSGDETTSEPTLAYTLDCSISNWDEPCLVHASPNESPSKTEIDLVINPTDPDNIVVAAKDNDRSATENCVWAVAQVSKDGGHTWTTSYVGGTLAEREPGDVLYDIECVSDPIMSFGLDGTLFYTLQASENTNEPDEAQDPVFGRNPDQAFQGLAISHDGGLTWPKDEISVLQPGDEVLVFPDYIRMETNPSTGTIYTSWQNIAGLARAVPILYSLDPETGQPASPPWNFANQDRTSMSTSSIVAANDGTVYACLCGLNSGGRAFLSKSTDDGATWTLAESAFTFNGSGPPDNVQFRVSSKVELAIDQTGGDRDGCMVATWSGKDLVSEASDDIHDVYARTSCDGGAVWTDPVLVNAGTQNGAQFFPRAAIDGHGNVHILYFTQHYDDVHDNQWLDAEWAYSTDFGTTWATQRLTTISFDGDLGVHQNGSPFIGDYNGIDALGDDVWMAFPTTHTGVAEIAVAHAVYNSGAQ